MSRRRGIMSESFKDELAKDLGFYDVVQREGWEGIRTKDAGNMVKRAIQIAQEQLVKQYNSAASTYPSVPSPRQPYSQPQSNYRPFNPIRSDAAGLNHIIARSQQAMQAEQRPY